VVQAPDLKRLTMSNLLWQTDKQVEWLRPFFPLNCGKPRVDDRRVMSGIVFYNRHDFRWYDTPLGAWSLEALLERW
jgi:transposase